MPAAAIEKAREAIEWKRMPFELTSERFSGIPKRLKEVIGQLINAPVDEIVLGNSASYGMHLLANGLPLKDGDEVLLTRGDFPSVIYPWLGLASKGVDSRFVTPANKVCTPEEVEAAISPKTRVFCATWVHSFSGRAIDLEAIGQICASKGVIFIANTTQAVGTRLLDISQTPIDALVNVGFKWLCGPYGTGFCWIRDELLQELTYNQMYWLSLQTADDLGSTGADPMLPSGPITGRKYDTFGTANFFNYVPWTASIEYILSHGVPAIAQHNEALVDHLIDNLSYTKYRLESPKEGSVRSTLTLVSHIDPDRNLAIYQSLKDRGIHIAFRRGKLRVSPHLYNTMEDIDRLLEALG